MLNLIDETTNMIEEFKQSKRGTLRVGASHAPIYSILPSTLKNICMIIQILILI